MEWLEANYNLIMLGWAALVGIAEFLKRVIPGTKDDKLIVKYMDMGGKILTIGASTFLPNQDGRK